MALKQHHYEARLLKLCDLLDTVPKRKFDYSTFFDQDWEKDMPIPTCMVKAGGCGTTACALGWAPSLPFARDGRRSPKVTLEDVVRYPSKAAAQLFGDRINLNIFYPSTLLYAEDGQRLESPDDDATPKQVAQFIRKAIKAGVAFY